MSDIADLKEYVENEDDLAHLKSLKPKIKVLNSYKKLSAASQRKLTLAEGQEEQKFKNKYDRMISKINQNLNNKIIQLVKKVNSAKKLLELMERYCIVGELCLTGKIRTLNYADLVKLQNQFMGIKGNADGVAYFLINKLDPFVNFKELFQLLDSESLSVLFLNEDTLAIRDDATLSALGELFKELSSLSKVNTIKLKSQITTIKKNIQDKIHEEYKRISKADLDQLRSLHSLIKDRGIKLKGLDKKIEKLESSTARN